MSTTLIMLSRDRLQYTRCALESLQATVGDLDWIVVDNGSRDGSAKYLREWASKDDRRTLVFNSRDPGAAEARNQAMAMARGEYVLCCSSTTMCFSMTANGWSTCSRCWRPTIPSSRRHCCCCFLETPGWCNARAAP